MNRWNPCSRRTFIRRLRILGFEGPFNGTRHQIMTYGTHRLPIPSSSEYSMPLLRRMIREVELLNGREIHPVEWASLE